MSTISEDISKKAAIITAIGDRTLYIENFRAIMEFNDTYIKMKTISGMIEVCGTRLNIVYYSAEDIKISGNFSEIRFL